MMASQRERFAVRFMWLALLLVPGMGAFRAVVEPAEHDPLAFVVVFAAGVAVALGFRDHPVVRRWLPVLTTAMLWAFLVRTLYVAAANGFGVPELMALVTLQAAAALTHPTVGQALLLHACVIAVPWVAGLAQGTELLLIVRDSMGLMGIGVFCVNDVVLRTEADVELGLRTRALEAMRDELEARVAARTEALVREVSVRTDAERRALEGSAAKSRFLATMSHELRTPLNAIQGYAELVEEELGPDDVEAKEDIGRIQRAGRHLLAMINDVLDLARVESGHLELRLESVALETVIDDAVAGMGPLLTRRGIELRRRAGPRGLRARMDRQRVEQVLVNLLGNAAKFAPHAPVDLTVTEAERSVRVRVRDHGPGIPAERLETVFEPFVQVDPSSTRPHDGTGLGLAISRDLARLMGGDLVVVPPGDGPGVAFELCLPLNGGGA